MRRVENYKMKRKLVFLDISRVRRIYGSVDETDEVMSMLLADEMFSNSRMLLIR